MSDTWTPVTKHRPCPACGHSAWCAFAPDGNLKCERTTKAPDGYRLITKKDNGAVFAPEHPAAARPRPPRSRAVQISVDLNAMLARCAAAITEAQLRTLADELGVTAESLRALGIGWATAADLRQLRASGAGWKDDRPDGAYAFPERDGAGTIVGFSFRAADGRKGSPSSKVGSRRGLIIPDNLAERSGPVLIVEGASDAAASLDMGMAAVGRPSNASGCDDLAVLLGGRNVIVLGENDRKDNGNWPGRDGAIKVAQSLSEALKAQIPCALPPEGHKDVRDFLKAKNAADEPARHEAGRAFMAALAHVEVGPAPEDSAEGSQSAQLVRMAQARYRLGCSTTGDGFAVAHDGPTLALSFNASRSGIGGALRAALHAQSGLVPGSAAVSDALAVLRHHAESAPTEAVHLRVARHDGSIVIDLGDADGRVVVASARGWEVRDRSPVLFRRSGLTQMLPIPQRDGGLEQLRSVLNVTENSWPLLLGWMVASFLPDIAHPILLLRGEQGTGKSTAAKILLSLIDPSGAPLRSVPDTVENWSVTANASWAICLDNISTIPEWLSDALCKAVTGDGLTRRARYTDSDLCVVSFRRVLLLTSIDPGALRGDLADRLLAVDLEPIPPRMRQTEQKLLRKFDGSRPQIFGALLDLLVKVLDALPRVQLDDLPRMADFAEVLAALDMVLGTGSLAQYSAQATQLAADVVDADEFAGRFWTSRSALVAGRGRARSCRFYSRRDRYRRAGRAPRARSLRTCAASVLH